MAQFARPNSTVDAGGWSYSDLSCHEDTDEITPNGDTDYVEADSADTTLKMGLSTVTDPVAGTGHILRFTAEALGWGGGPEKLDVSLYEDTTLIVAAFGNQAINRGSYLLYEYTLSETEANSITDYSALRVWFFVDTLAGGETIRVTQCELEVPDAGGTTYYQSCDGVWASTGGLSRLITPGPRVGVFNMSGSVLKKTTPGVYAGTLAMTGAIIKKGFAPLAGVLAMAGDLVGSLVKIQAVSGTLDFAGILVKKSYEPLAGAFGFTGSLLRKTSILSAGILNATGSLIRQGFKPIQGVLAFTGSISAGKLAQKALAGVVSFAGDGVRFPGKALGGVLDLTGILQRKTSHFLAGTLGMAGAIVKKTSKFLVSVLTFTGEGTGEKPGSPGNPGGAGGGPQLWWRIVQSHRTRQ